MIFIMKPLNSVPKKAQSSPKVKKFVFYTAATNVVASLGSQPSCLSFFK